MDRFAQRLLRWYTRQGRHELPWQHPRTPYRVWVSEVMLQQTRVATAIPYFQRFVAALPDLRTLAAADEDQVLALWSGLGYYRRAQHLHSAARLAVAQHHGELPDDFDALAALPGIGRSTAGAILALARGQRRAILDGNAKRVLARYHGIRGWPGKRATADALWRFADAHTPAVRVADYTQAIMDLGATTCTRRQPQCGTCPLAAGCMARRAGTTAVIPATRAHRTLPERHTVFVVLRDAGGRVLLQRRPPAGVWPALWSLPEAADARVARTLAAHLAVAAARRPEMLPDIRHTFTHFKLRGTVLAWRGVRARRAIADRPDLRWCGRAELTACGMPAPIRKLLAAIASAGSAGAR